MTDFPVPVRPDRPANPFEEDTVPRSALAEPVAGTTRWGAVVAASSAIVLAALDLTIVAVALPSLGAEFAAPPALTQWVLLAYFLPMTALGIPVGRWIDGAGLRQAFSVAVAGFGLASVLIALSPQLWLLLLLGRVLQGGFGSMISVLGFPIVAATVRPDQRGRAMGLIGTLIPLSGLAGPALGGLLAEVYGWRAVFAVNVPVVVATLWFGLRTIPGGEVGRRGLPLPGRGIVREVLLLGGAVTAVFLALGWIAGGAVDGGLGLLLVLVAAAGLAGTAWRRLETSRPVIALVRSPAFGLPVTALLLMVVAMGGTFFLVPYLFSEVLHPSADVTGLVLLASAAGMAALSPLAGWLADRVGAARVALAGGLVLLAGTVALLQLGDQAQPVDVAWRLAVLGVGNGLVTGPVHALILAATPAGMAATAGGVSALFRTLGLSLGAAAGALAWTVTGGGLAGFRGGVAVITATTLAGLAALAGLWLHGRRHLMPLRSGTAFTG